MRSAGVVILVLAMLGAGRALATQEPPATSTPPAQEATPAVPRPDLALSLRDIPPGYEEASPVGLTVGNTRIEDRALRRSAPGIGPYYLSSGVYEAGPPPMTEDRLARVARDITVVVTRGGAPALEFGDWDELDAEGVGDFGHMYSFRVRVTASDARSEGALAVFSRANLVAYLLVLNADGRATADLRLYTRTLDDRLQRDLRERPGAAQP